MALYKMESLGGCTVWNSARVVRRAVCWMPTEPTEVNLRLTRGTAATDLCLTGGLTNCGVDVDRERPELIIG